jgi:hypothetical protein
VTVLAKYQRLEAEGLWRPEPEAQRRDVIVSIGDATLTIASANGSALSHWSLPAIVRTNPGLMPAVYAPGEDTPETLELADTEVVDAIEAVLKSIQSGGSHPGRLRSLTIGAALVVVLAGAVIWLPQAITRYTASLVPEGARTEIGARLREEIRKLTGAPCAESAGLRALEKLQSRLFPEGRTTLVVIPSALAETTHLPGGTILISHRLVEDHETPDVLAGYLLAEDIRRSGADPLERVLSDAGLGAALQLLTTGRIDDEALRRHDTALVTKIKTAGVSGQPYAYAIDLTGEGQTPLIEASKEITQTLPLIGDGDWLALQRICEG